MRRARAPTQTEGYRNQPYGCNRMMQISDTFLLTVAEISAGLIGLFLVGVIVYLPGRARGIEGCDVAGARLSRSRR